MWQTPADWIIFITVFALASSSLVPVSELFPPKPYKFGYAIKDKQGGQYREEAGDGVHNVRGSYGFVDDRGVRRHVTYVADKEGFRAQVKTNEPGTAPQDPAGVKMESTAAEENPIPSSASEFEKQFKKEARDSKLSIEKLIKEYLKEKEGKKKSEGMQRAEAAFQELAKLGLYRSYVPDGKDGVPFYPIGQKKKGLEMLGVGYLSPQEFALRLLHQGKAKSGLSKEYEGSPLNPEMYRPSSYREQAALYKKELEKKELMKGIALSSSGKDKLSFVPIF